MTSGVPFSPSIGRAELDTLYTIGGYGYDADAFVAALKDHGVDAVVDVRQRRGMRGRDYAWANARRLEERLLGEGISYLPSKELAPTSEVRAVQHAADERLRAGKRQRQELSPEFREAYFRAILEPLNPAQTAARLSEGGAAPALFCTERVPSACHRSLVAEWLRREGFVSSVIHVIP